MTVFNIYGMCILRDVFSFIPQSKYSVQHFLQWSHPVTNFIYTTKPNEKLELKHFGHEDKMNFKERCIINDYNNTVLDYYENQSDYFLLDLVAMAHTDVFKEVQEDGSIHYFTNSQVFGDLLDVTELNKSFFSRKKYNRVPALKIMDEVGYEKVIDAYIKWLTEEKGYRQEQIILVENKSVHYWSDGQYLFELQYDFHKQNNALNEYYAYFKKRCPGCHVIKFPCDVYADYYHRWGLSDLHYCIEYYEYLYACIDAIVNDNDCEVKVNKLFEQYSERFMSNIWKLMKNDFELATFTNLLKGELTSKGTEAIYAPRGTKYFQGINNYAEIEELEFSMGVVPYGLNNCKVTINEQLCYVDRSMCKRGFIGSGKELCDEWITMNSTTEAEVTRDSVIVRHNGIKKAFQTQIIQIVKDNTKLKGKPVTFSCFVRVLKHNSEGKGGSIALINADGYNGGVFLIHKSFDNTEWQRVFLTTILPAGDNFHGLTVCLRALVTSKGDGAEVEFKNPKLEIGAFPTLQG